MIIKLLEIISQADTAIRVYDTLPEKLEEISNDLTHINHHIEENIKK